MQLLTVKHELNEMQKHTEGAKKRGNGNMHVSHCADVWQVLSFHCAICLRCLWPYSSMHDSRGNFAKLSKQTSSLSPTLMCCGVGAA